MNSIMGLVCSGDQKFWIENVWISMRYVTNVHWVHVMNNNPGMYLIPIHAKVATQIPGDHIVTYLTPLSRCIELLVDPTVVTESGFADLPPKGQIPVAFFEGLQSPKFSVLSNHRTHHQVREALVQSRNA